MSVQQSWVTTKLVYFSNLVPTGSLILPFPSSLAPGDGMMRDPVNEVVTFQDNICGFHFWSGSLLSVR